MVLMKETRCCCDTALLLINDGSLYVSVFNVHETLETRECGASIPLDFGRDPIEVGLDPHWEEVQHIPGCTAESQPLEPHRN